MEYSWISGYVQVVFHGKFKAGGGVTDGNKEKWETWI